MNKITLTHSQFHTIWTEAVGRDDYRKKLFRELEYTLTKKEVIVPNTSKTGVDTITPKVGVGVIICNEEGEILVGKRINAQGHGDGEWSLPGGHVEMMEDLKDTCKREVLEETGLEIKVVGKCESFPYSNDRFLETSRHYITLFFVAEVVGGNLQNMEPDKCEGWEWFDIKKMPSPLFPPLREMCKSFVG